MKTEPYPDEKLLNMLRGDGRELALIHIYQNQDWRSSIAALIRNNGSDIEQIEELYLDTLIAFERNIRRKKYEGRSSLKTYFVSIAKFLLFTQTRRAGRLEFRATLAEEGPPSNSDPAIELFSAEKRKLLQKVIQTMDAPCKSVLVMWGLSYSMKEIAQELGLENADKAKKLAYRCRKKLRNKVKNDPVLMAEFKAYYEKFK